MKPYNGYEQSREDARKTGSMQLPVGAYECKILKAEPSAIGKKATILVYFDITAGEYKDFFKTNYENQTGEDKKWKGRTQIYCPTDDGSEQDGWTKKTFGRWINALEDSNKNYKWDWDESKWKNKAVGIMFGETGNKINGKDVKYTEARAACSIQDVKDGKAPTEYFCKFKTRNGYGEQPKNIDTDWQSIPDVGNDEDLPF